MKPALIAAGAAVLVLGLALVFASPSIVTMGIYRSEFNQLGSPTQNSSSISSMISYYANIGEVVLIAGVILAPLGAAILAYGISTKMAGDAGKQAIPSTESYQN